ncbi:MAG: tRNA (N6-isopentenyl adenosine(37)-C2)-methylthiotransferase MiaB, partial [Elusimicrobia bacterium]|nr:tRNA (N6-isopentenyl adenosine(37)-C2)-methylthiotransferase MiaB [Elusimicrobiota bacterium]
GCQMNIYDSELMSGILHEHGYQQVFEPKDAGLIIINTCSVRKHAEERAFSNLWDLFHQAPKKAKKPVFCVAGCIAKKMGEEIFRKYPFVDMVISPANIYDLPKIIQAFTKTGQKQLAIKSQTSYIKKNFPVIHTNKVKALVTIMQGCENYCAYCVVPFVRGKEISRPLKNIVAEVRDLVKKGYREVTLLGQNVNSYHDCKNDFSTLLKKISSLPGLQRVRFMTNHPKDMSDKLIKMIGKLDKVCGHIHLPLQSGSDQVLQAMNRGYTAAHFLDLVKKLRRSKPDLAITTDIIVGFPGETKKDFQKTLSLVKRAKFDASFVFKYSPRTGTTASGLADDVSAAEKQRRLALINQAQQKIARKLSHSLIGQNVEVLVENLATDGKNLFGKTAGYRTVIINTSLAPDQRSATSDQRPPLYIGQLIPVKIASAKNWTLFGKSAIR